MSTLTKTALVSAVALLVASATDHKAKATAASEVSQSAIANLRAVANLTHDGEMPTEQAKAFIVASLKAAGMKPGSAKPYATAFSGYRNALAEGVDITTGHGEKGDKPLTAPAAREFNLPLAEREARAKLAEARKELSKRIAACDDLNLLAELTELLPEVVKADKSGTVTMIDPLSLIAGLSDDADEAMPATGTNG